MAKKAKGNPKWFVVHTYSGYEDKVHDDILAVCENKPALKEEILKVEVPKERIIKIKNGKETEDEKKRFPGYVFVKVCTEIKWQKIGSNRTVSGSELTEEQKSSGAYTPTDAMKDEVWYIIRNTRGVTGFVGPDSNPQALSKKELIDMGLEKEENKAKAENVAVDDDDDFFDMDDFAAEEKQNVIIEVDYDIGSEVEVINGAFEGNKGVVKSIDFDSRTVVVDIPIFGRETPTEFALDEVKLV